MTWLEVMEAASEYGQLCYSEGAARSRGTNDADGIAVERLAAYEALRKEVLRVLQGERVP